MHTPQIHLGEHDRKIIAKLRRSFPTHLINLLARHSIQHHSKALQAFVLSHGILPPDKSEGYV